VAVNNRKPRCQPTAHTNEYLEIPYAAPRRPAPVVASAACCPLSKASLRERVAQLITSGDTELGKDLVHVGLNGAR
jgi:hypothetical protein